ncbi:MarR family winged helix-turn-helix transcriptional regulator [Streptomyces sp. AS58]|uniref:MarR family winged helix-turn-helix transcriptional regulator n=1 Tax=Streptomyces sp. AS58 TaxID=1519489 RepID=UPI0007C7ED49|nr:MarR family transcriptional regulator [Streptomyces sp. AS58]
MTTDGFYPGEDPSDQRQWRIIDALRRYGTDSTRLTHAFASQHQLRPVDLFALVAIMSAEGASTPLTPGELQGHLRLSSAGTSYLIDRLEASGHVRRSREDADDHRKVRLRYKDEGMRTALAFFGPLDESTNAILDQFNASELDVIARFTDAIAQAMKAHVEQI